VHFQTHHGSEISNGICKITTITVIIKTIGILMITTTTTITMIITTTTTIIT
jgi:hypothetical protein